MKPVPCWWKQDVKELIPAAAVELSPRVCDTELDKSLLCHTALSEFVTLRKLMFSFQTAVARLVMYKS